MVKQSIEEIRNKLLSIKFSPLNSSNKWYFISGYLFSCRLNDIITNKEWVKLKEEFVPI